MYVFFPPYRGQYTMGLILILGGALHYSTVLGLLHYAWSTPRQKEHLKNVSFSSILLYMIILIMCHQHASTHTCVRVAQLSSTEP